MPIKVDIVLFFQWKIFFLPTFFILQQYSNAFQRLFCSWTCLCSCSSQQLRDGGEAAGLRPEQKHYHVPSVEHIMEETLQMSEFSHGWSFEWLCVWHSGASGGLEDAKGCDIQTVVTGSNFAKWRTHCSNTRSSLGWLHLFLFLTNEMMALKTQKYVSWNKLNSDYDPFLFTVCVILFLFSDWVN